MANLPPQRREDRAERKKQNFYTDISYTNYRPVMITHATTPYTDYSFAVRTWMLLPALRDVVSDSCASCSYVHQTPKNVAASVGTRSPCNEQYELWCLVDERKIVNCLLVLKPFLWGKLCALPSGPVNVVFLFTFPGRYDYSSSVHSLTLPLYAPYYPAFL